jgi:hypothetical protein
MSLQTQQTAPSKEKQQTASDSALRVLAIVMCVGIVGVAVYAAQTSNLPKFFSVASFGVIVAGASAMVGGLLGFLFGIPHTLQGEPNATTQGVAYRANTNLEQISDWLTKILVGVGLTQLTEIPTQMKKVATFLAGGLGSPESASFALAIIVFFVVCGFLFGFLWTRLFLAGALMHADVAALGALAAHVDQASKQVDQKLAQLKDQERFDAVALSLANRQLNPSSDSPAPKQEELNEAIKAASSPVKVTIFNQAQTIRSENWRFAEKKEIMERTIPIFRALIASDEKNEFHRNHGQLGFALKDKRTPDWAAAEAELTQAIEIRGDWRERGWLFYEFNRAICRIMQDEDYANKRKSKAEVKQRILDDLRAAAQSEIKTLIPGMPDIASWMTLNRVSMQDLTS